MLATVDSCLLAGLEGRLVEVQADAGNGKPEFHLVGLAATSVREARQRVRSAIKNSDLPFPLARLTVNLAPPEMRKEGGSLDLAIAVSIVLAHDGRKPPDRTAYLGELALDGGVRHVEGVLVAVRWLRDHGFRTVFVPAADAAEAALVGDIEVIPSPDLASVIAHISGDASIAPQPLTEPTLPSSAEVELDLSEVHGQEEAKRALELARSGCDHALADDRRPLAHRLIGQKCRGDAPDIHLQVDAVEQRPRELAPVGVHQRGGAPACPAAVSRPTAWAWVGGGHQGETGGKRDRAARSCDGDATRLEGLAQRLEDRGLKLRQLIHEKDPVVRP